MLDRNSLIEKFVVMGIDSTKDTFTYNNIIEDQVHPTFLDIFPFEQQESPSYLDNFKLWCFPDGLSIYNENVQKINGLGKSCQQSLQQQNSLHDTTTQNNNNNNLNENIMSKNMLHHFVLTNQNTEKKYCSCLIIHEEVYINIDDKSRMISSQLQTSIAQNNNMMKLYVPKIICVISNCPVLEFQKQFLAFIYKFTITSKLMKQPPKLQIYSHLFERFTSLLNEEKSFQAAEKKWDEEIYSQTLDTIKKHPFDQSNNNYANNNEITKQFKLKEEFLINFSISMLFRVHTLKNLSQKNSEIIFTLSNEEVCRLRPLSDPSNNTNANSNNNNFFILNNFSFRPLIEKISVKTAVCLVESILLERQIILISSNPNEIISICESIFTLIYPLKWACIYIPLLPIQLSEMISAMMPYIIGITKKNYLLIQNKIDHKDKVVIDLDNDTIQQTQIHRLPEYLTIYLNNNFKELFRKFHQSKSDEQKKKNAWIEVIFQLKRIFLNFMTCLINNFTPFFLYSNNFDKDNVASKDIFAKSDYLSIFDSSDEKSFMTELCQNTMMFSKFLEDSYRILYTTEFKKEKIDLNNDDKDGLYFFLKNIKKIHKSLPKCNSEKKFDIIQNPMIFSALDYELSSQVDQAILDYQNPTTIDLTPHLIKYLKFIENKTPEIQSNYTPGSAKQISQSKTVFKKLEKEWLMPIPKPQIHIDRGEQNKKNFNDCLDNNDCDDDHENNNNQQFIKQQQQQLQQNYGEDSCQIKSLDNSLLKSSQQITSNNNNNNNNNLSHNNNNNVYTSVNNNNPFIAPKENYKDPYYVNEQYQEPSILQEPIIFYRNVQSLEYDTWHNRVFEQEFDRLILEFPLKRQLEIQKQYKLFMAPQNRPYIKNTVEHIYKNLELNNMLEQVEIQKQQSIQQQQNQLYSNYNQQQNQNNNYNQNQQQQYQNNNQNQQRQYYPPRENNNYQDHLNMTDQYYNNKNNNNNKSHPHLTDHINPQQQQQPYKQNQNNNMNVNYKQLPPLPHQNQQQHHQQYNTTTHEDTLSSNRQSLSKMRTFQTTYQTNPINNNNMNKNNNSFNNTANINQRVTAAPKNQDSLFNKNNTSFLNRKSRTNSVDNPMPFRPLDVNTTAIQQNNTFNNHNHNNLNNNSMNNININNNGKMNPPNSLTINDKFSNNYLTEQIIPQTTQAFNSNINNNYQNIPPKGQTNNNNNVNQKRLSIFQSNNNPQKPSSLKEINPRSTSNNENVNINNAPIPQQQRQLQNQQQQQRWDQNQYNLSNNNSNQQNNNMSNNYISNKIDDNNYDEYGKRKIQSQTRIPLQQQYQYPEEQSNRETSKNNQQQRTRQTSIRARGIFN